MTMNEAPTAPAEAPAPAAPAEAAPVAPVETAPAAPAETPAAPAAPAAPTPEQDAVNKQLAAQQAVQRVIQSKEDAAAKEIAAVCQKHGVELIVSHAVKVRFIQQG
jgi:nucleoid-associated protein YgaU